VLALTKKIFRLTSTSARDLMELSCHKMLPGQDVQRNALHLWTLKWQAKAVSNGVSIREDAGPLRFGSVAIAGLVCAFWRAMDL
jgi:hypothetical protein